MARRAQSASPQKPQHETKVEEHWWKTPTVIATVIAALAVISVWPSSISVQPRSRKHRILPEVNNTRISRKPRNI